MTESLAPFAVTEQNSRGRHHPEPPHRWRGPFDRDRDRIIHSAAFRRLEGKTQVFTTGLNDHYRTRLTHSIEVSQIGRTIAQALSLNESLTEAVCLAHDLGHSPFGHTGQTVLQDLMQNHGGFEHNRQALRIVESLENPYPDFAGLNLMYETRHALSVHSSPYDRPLTDPQFPPGPCCLEGQIADLADRIAYNTHDLEDGIRARLIEENRICNLALIRQAWEQVGAGKIDDFVIRRTRIVKAVLNQLATDVIETSLPAIKEFGIRSLDDVYNQPRSLIVLSPAAETQVKELESFLLKNLYENEALKKNAQSARIMLTRLFSALCENPSIMPAYYQKRVPAEGTERTVCDYLAGMTDRFAIFTLKNLSN